MSEYGLKIKNFQAGSLYEYGIGTRDNLDYTDAMFTNSLFSDFLKRNGLNIWKEESTRDIICIEFDYGTRSFQEEKSHLEKLLDNVKHDQMLTTQEKEKKKNKIKELIEFTEQNKDKYTKLSNDQLRDIFYQNGISVKYKTYKKNIVIKEEEIHYKMLYRTPGKAKKGSCMFINEALYELAEDYIRMGIKMNYDNAPIVEIGAYSPLITSSIVGKIQIMPHEILVINDVDSFFKTKIISVETNKNKNCIAKPIDEYELKNTLFDGQALIDTSIFPSWGEGYVLLRQHFCKMAAFHTNIKLFMRDYYGEQYETAIIKDMFGRDVKVKDIKLITTDNAMKWLKFNVSFDYWISRVAYDDYNFGVVKTAHKSKLGEVQRMSYQMVNSLSEDIMEDATSLSINYIEQLKQDDNIFLDYLRKNQNFSNDFSVLIALCEQDIDFTRSEYFRSRKSDIIKSYVLNMKNGRIIQNADNLVIVGSPYAMLLHSIGENPFDDDTFAAEEGTIQCYTKRFADGEYLAEFRSPFNSKNNMGYLHNIYNNKLQRYFNFGKQIIAINMINTDFQDRNNGSDQDSDSIYTTNHPRIVEYAKYCYENYPTIVNNIPKEKTSYCNTLKDFAIVDNNLAKAQLAIGESSNLAQLCLTYTYNSEQKKYIDYVCILSVLAQVAIDNAKRRFDIDLTDEIKRIKKDMDINKNKRPLFWTIIRKNFDKKFEDIKKECIKNNEKIPWDKSKINSKLKCPMNYIYNIKLKEFKPETSTLPMSDFFVKYSADNDRRKSKKVEELIQKYSLKLYDYNAEYQDDDNDKYLLLRADFDELIRDIQQIYISKNYQGMMSWLIDRAFLITPNIKSNNANIKSTINTNKSLLLKVLYDVNSEAFLKCFSKKICTPKDKDSQKSQ